MKKSKNFIDPAECEFIPIRSSGPGGQHANKVETGILLKFDIFGSSLPESVKGRLIMIPDSRISKDFVISIRATTHRSQSQNRIEAVARLQELVDLASHEEKKRKKTKIPRKAVEKRLDEKSKRGEIKQKRKKPAADL